MVVLGAIVGVLLWMAAPKSPNRKPVAAIGSTSTNRRLQPGDEVRVSSGCHAGVTDDDYDRVLELARANDKMGILDMRLAKRAAYLQAGTRCLVIKRGGFASEVRVLEGKYAGRAFFTANSNLGE
ncbi:MAG: hypothetical protein V2A76_09260 [Planctomycetota bacterium]